MIHKNKRLRGVAELRPGRYHARITVLGVHHSLGVYSTPEQADAVVKDARRAMVTDEVLAKRREHISAAAKAAWSGKKGRARRKRLQYTYGFK